SVWDGGEDAHAQVARPGVVEVEPDAAVVGAFLRYLNRVAELQFEQRIRVGIDPHRNRPAPAAFLVGEVSLDGIEDSTIARQHVGNFETTPARDALALGDAEHGLVEPGLE